MQKSNEPPDDPRDHPFLTVVERCLAHLMLGHAFHQKFTCEQCRARLTIETPNQLYTTGKCEHCSHETDLRKRGCNFLLIISVKRKEGKNGTNNTGTDV